MVTSILVALATYLVVFNMTFIIKISTAKYRVKRELLVKEMQSRDWDREWKTRGQSLEVFPPHTKNRKLTEWLILVYWFRQRFGSGTKTEEVRERHSISWKEAPIQKEGGEEAVMEESIGNSTGRRYLSRLARWRNGSVNDEMV